MLHPTCVFANSPEVLHTQEQAASGGDGSRGTGSPGGGGEKPSIRGVRGHSDLGVPLAVGGYPLTPPTLHLPWGC